MAVTKQSEHSHRQIPAKLRSLFIISHDTGIEQPDQFLHLFSFFLICCSNVSMCVCMYVCMYVVCALACMCMYVRVFYVCRHQGMSFNYIIRPIITGDIIIFYCCCNNRPCLQHIIVKF